MIGWREWVVLPDLKSVCIKAKIDTGARTSALHAENIEFFKKGKKTFARFSIFPIQKNREKVYRVVSEVIDFRKIRSSVGVVTERPVIITELKVGNESWSIELTLINRDIMGFRMLVGRQAIRKKLLVDPGKSFLIGK